MSEAFTLGLIHTAMYWAPGTPDGYGGIAFDPPVVITCRWEDKVTQFRDAAGAIQVSDAVVYPDRQLELKGMLMLGAFMDDANYANPIELEVDGLKPKEIRGRGSSPSFDGALVLYKVFL